MRAVLALAALNALSWGTFLAAFPGSHFAWPGSYPFWAYDDAPWVVLAISVVAPLALVASRLRAVPSLIGTAATVTIFTLLAFLPYVACSGGGV
jgi:hypothetical protein